MGQVKQYSREYKEEALKLVKTKATDKIVDMLHLNEKFGTRKSS